MKNNIITTILGLALLTVAPGLAQTSLPSGGEQTTQPSELRVVQTSSTSTRPTANSTEPANKPTRLSRPQLLKVGDVQYNPRGRSRHDKAPEPRPLIYVDGFEF